SNACDYYSRYLKHRQIARNAYDELAAEYELIVIEGAGSPAEINLQPRDLVNMQMAHYAEARVLIVGDIDCGGVFAWMKGTYDLIEDAYKPLVHGFIINKFRGDRSLLEPGIEMFEQMINLPIMGVIPYFRDIRVDEEDSIPLDGHISSGRMPLPHSQAKEFSADGEQVIIGVIVPPHISNFTDFTPLELEPDVVLRFLRSPAEADLCDCLILPGSKATLADARYLAQGRGQGWFHRIKDACDRGVAVVGICGGYQMLGEKLFDPHGVESDLKEIDGLGLLPAVTTISLRKVLKQVNYRTLPSMVFPETFPEPLRVTGYEIHMGQTQIRGGRVRPLFDTPDITVGVMSEDRPVLGTYIHGIFDDDQARRSFINWLRQRKGLPPRPAGFSYQLFRQDQIDKLAAVVREHCDMERISGWLRP
ncbi:MAG TPA: cobyric acid synthase, partial [Desulfatiglandales bacterium]|nr:cobyric acid synthase [Desulfatiglandales bacterium]